MRRCPNCGQKLALLSRDRFCSSTCSDSFRREEARWWELSSVDCNTKNGYACEPKEDAEDDAAQFIWASILTTANYIRKRQPFLPKPRRKVIKLKEGSTAVPLYFIGGGLFELRLSQMMNVDRAIYAVEVPWPSAWRQAATRNKTTTLPNMEALAAGYTKALSSHVKSSRCVLAGISFYGLVAFEVAHQLSKAGLKVEMVMLLDTQAVYLAPPHLAWRKLTKDWRDYRTRKSPSRTLEATVRPLSMICSALYSMVFEQVRSLVRSLIGSIVPDSRYPTTKLDDDGVPLHLAFLKRVYAKAIRSYRLGPLDCRGVLFRANLERESLARAVDGSLGWDKLFAKGLEIKKVSGDHRSMVSQHPHNLALASKMSRVLNESGPPQNSTPLIAEAS
jgi:thioesterase domain-containing protein